jgi:adenylate cyclase class 2
LSIETEVKVKIDDAESFCRRLEVWEPEILSGRHFEDNHLLDYPDGRLRAGQCLIRVRHALDRAFLTFKGPPKAEGIFKTREELETGLGSADVACRIFERLGLCLWFRYQKYRREYRVDGVHVAVDETPVGNYVEFEGSEEEIHALARRLGIDPSEFSKSSYYSLYLQHCREKGVAPRHMVF